MSLLITMLPVYLVGNLHCLGMCGPLVLLLGQHRHRTFYFFGRMVSFTLAAAAAGQAGAVLNVVLRHYQIPAIASFLFGGIILTIGLFAILGRRYPGHSFFARATSGLSNSQALLLARDRPWPIFLFGFFTVFLPCGQTLLVFSACALSGDPAVGLLNGFAFAALTSPSLWFAMRAHSLLAAMKKHYNLVMGILALIVGALALCRGLAEVGVIFHWVITVGGFHMVLY